MAKAKAKKDTNGQYEAMFLLASSFATELENAIKLVRGIVERHEGKVLVAKKWDERKLSYELGGQKRGLYIIVYFTAPGAAVASIERDVNLSDQVLRVLVTKADHLNAEEMAAVEPQPIQPREERAPWDRPSYDDRGPRGGDRGGDRSGDRGDRPYRAPRDDAAPEAAAAKE
jgi:small subunit ribosomal protein S6